jgi:hypothetical protein
MGECVDQRRVKRATGSEEHTATTRPVLGGVDRMQKGG